MSTGSRRIRCLCGQIFDLAVQGACPACGEVPSGAEKSPNSPVPVPHPGISPQQPPTASPAPGPGVSPVPKPVGRRQVLFLVLGAIGLVGTTVAAVKFWPKPILLPTSGGSGVPQPGTTSPAGVPSPGIDKYVGVWEQALIPKSPVWEFKKDGTVIVTPFHDGKTLLIPPSNGKWREENGILKLDFQRQQFTIWGGARQYDGKFNAEGPVLTLTLTQPIGEIDVILLRRKQ